MTTKLKTGNDLKKQPTGRQNLLALGWFILMSFLIVGLDIADGNHYVVDVDDDMRKFLIRDLLADGQWRDMVQPYLQMPGDYVSPWSRIVDLPYVVLTWVLSGFMAPDVAMELAFLIVPVALLPIFCGLAYAIVVRVLGQTPSALSTTLMALLMVFAILQFSPGRIDHHNMQLLAMLAAIWGVFWGKAKGGLVVGISCAVSIGIGLEALPIIAALYGALTLAWIMDRPGASDVLKYASGAIGLGVLFFAWQRFGWQFYQKVECDVISMPFVAAGIILGGWLWLCMMLEDSLNSVIKRLAALSIGGVIGIGVVILLYPECLNGPYSMVDDVSRNFWLDLAPGESDIVTGILAGRSIYAYMVIPVAVICALFAPIAFRRLAADKWQSFVVFATAVAAVIVTLVQARFYIFPVMLGALMVPVFVEFQLRDTQLAAKRFSAKLFVGSVVVLGLVAGALAYGFSGSKSFTPELRALHVEECTGEDMGVLDSVPRGRILVPLGLAMPIVKGNYDHAVSALPFHRAAPGIRRVALAFMSPDPQVQRAAMGGFDYLAVCQDPKIADRDVAPLYVALMQGDAVEGLEPVPTVLKSRFKLYRIQK